MAAATHMDLYQLSSLVPHFDAGLIDQRVTMNFFSRSLPSGLHGEPCRGYLLFAGLRRCIEWLLGARFTTRHMDTLQAHPMLGPVLLRRPELRERLLDWHFQGEIEAPPEGTPLFAGHAVDHEGNRIDVGGIRPSAYTPYLQIQTDLLSAKLIETPLLSIINHMTMVASKAARVVEAAGNRAVLEFGTRRTHPQAAVDAAYAAYLAGAAGTSNVEAYHRYSVPALGTMDHFAVQAWERDGVPRAETEAAFFAAFHQCYPAGSVLLVDTYDTFGEHTGIRSAVKATAGQLAGIRIDSNVTRENIWKARKLLDELGATKATICVSGGMDEDAIRELGDAPVDAFGIGERIVTSPDAPVGVGAVGKISEVEGRPTMKMSQGSSKATLPGRLQVFRQGNHDIVACHDEVLPGRPLLQQVWKGRSPTVWPELEESRARARREIAALEDRSPRQVDVEISEKLHARVCDCVKLAH